jgi:HAD superfamily phosphatase
VKPRSDKGLARIDCELIIFDVDGVLVDVRESYQRTVLETVKKLTGKRVSRRELHEWKNQPGFNDDWTLTHAWTQKLGSELSFEEVKREFEKMYWGDGNGSGNVARERWLLTPAQLRRLSQRVELAIFTGRTQEELGHTLERFDTRKFFARVVTVEDVRKPKPDPEGLLQILRGRPPEAALYIGDNVDDALAARAAGVMFAGVLPRGSEERRIRAARLREFGARTIFGEVRELERWMGRGKLNN